MDMLYHCIISYDVIPFPCVAVRLQPLHICRGQGPTTQVDHVSGDQLGDGEGLGLPIPQTSGGRFLAIPGD